MKLITLAIMDIEKFDIPMALLISLISIVVVFLILILIIGVCEGLFRGVDKVDDMLHINARNEDNKLLNEDNDAAVALIAATIEFHKETGKNAKLIKIEKIDE